MRFQNPQNNYIEEVELPGLWVFLFGAFYFAVKGVWTHVVVSLLLVFCTFGLSWVVYPFLAAGIMEKHYLSKGWIKIS